VAEVAVWRSYFGTIRLITAEALGLDSVIEPYSVNKSGVLDAVLGTVEKPGRYCGGERNAIKKDLSRVLLKVVLAFPDIYEIGMSHVGLKILYNILNLREMTAAERVFMPWRDFARALRRLGLPLYSLESKLPLSAFDVIGFSLQHELCYTGVLEMLDLGGVPIHASERGENMPLVIGGGPCTFNPEPLWEFFDLFVVGDGEDVVSNLADLWESCKREGWTRAEAISRARDIPGVYVPGDYEFEYSCGYVSKVTHAGKVYEDPFAVPKVERAFVEDLESAPYPEKPVVPNIAVVHDRAPVEIMRGCLRGCRFCQAGYICRPARERSVGNVTGLAESIIANTGFEEVSFLSLSSGDYSGIERLIRHSAMGFAGHKVAVSLPSLRVETMTQAIVDGIRSMKKTGFTVAPEAATERLRRVINKPISNEMVLDAVRRAFIAGWKRVKLYFMIGLPSETDEDIDAIVELARQLGSLARSSGGCKVAISISTFIPKPHTAFQWAPQASHAEIVAKFSRLRHSISGRNVELKWHNAEMSVIEGILCRGDRRLSAAVERAWRSGCVLDNWSEEFSFDRWMAALEGAGLTYQDYVAEREPDKFLPWEHISCGVSRRFLLGERDAAEKERPTPDCLVSGECQLCGACSDASSYLKKMQATQRAAERSKGVSSMGGTSRRETMGRASARKLAFPLRCKYERTGPSKFISHLEALTALGRAARQSGLPVEFSKGFNPQPRISAGLPLSTGHASLAEYVDIRVTRPVSPEKLISLMNDCLMEGIRFVAARHLFRKSLSLCALVSEIDYSVVVSLGRLAEAGHALGLRHLDESQFHEELIERLLSQRSIMVSKVTPKRRVEIDLRRFVGALNMTGVEGGKAYLGMTLKVDRNGRTARPAMVLSALYGLTENILYFSDITRMEQYYRRGGMRRPLLDVGGGLAPRGDRLGRARTRSWDGL